MRVLEMKRGRRVRPWESKDRRRQTHGDVIVHHNRGSKHTGHEEKLYKNDNINKLLQIRCAANSINILLVKCIKFCKYVAIRSSLHGISLFFPTTCQFTVISIKTSVSPDYIRLKGFAWPKKHRQKQIEWETIFSHKAPVKGLISKIGKALTKLNNKKT